MSAVNGNRHIQMTCGRDSIQLEILRGVGLEKLLMVGSGGHTTTEGGLHSQARARTRAPLRSCYFSSFLARGTSLTMMYKMK